MSSDLVVSFPKAKTIYSHLNQNDSQDLSRSQRKLLSANLEGRVLTKAEVCDIISNVEDNLHDSSDVIKVNQLASSLMNIGEEVPVDISSEDEVTEICYIKIVDLTGSEKNGWEFDRLSNLSVKSSSQDSVELNRSGSSNFDNLDDLFDEVPLRRSGSSKWDNLGDLFDDDSECGRLADVNLSSMSSDEESDCESSDSNYSGVDTVEVSKKFKYKIQ